MAFLDEIARYIDKNSTTLTLATNLWKSWIPDKAPATSVLVLERGGIAPSRGLGSTSGPVFETPSVQVLSRSTSYQTARANAETIYRLLDKVANQTLYPTSSTSTGGTYYVSIDALQSPFPIGRDGSGAHQVSVNFLARKELS